MLYKVAVVTMSDKGSLGLRLDESGPLISSMMKEWGQAEVVETKLIPDDFETHFPASLPGAFGSAAAGAGILVTVLAGSASGGSYLDTAWQLFGLAAPVCFLLAGLARALGKKPFFLLHVVPCLFFLVHIVTRYQLWSSQPQMVL